MDDQPGAKESREENTDRVLSWARLALLKQGLTPTAWNLSIMTGYQASEYLCQQWLDQQAKKERMI